MQEKYCYVDQNYYQCFSNTKTIDYRKSIESDKIIIDYQYGPNHYNGFEIPMINDNHQ